MKTHKSKALFAFSLIELSVVVVIIALIIAAISQSSRLVSQMRITNARKITNNSAIPALNNIVAWYDSTSIEAFNVEETDHTDKISKWVDSEVRVHERIVLFQSDDTKKPTYYQNSINGLPAIYFDGNDYLESTIVTEKSPENLIAYSSATIFTVFEAEDISGKKTILSQDNNGTNDDIDLAISLNNNGDYGICFNGSDCSAANNSRTNSAIVSAKKVSILSAIVKNGTNIEIYQDTIKMPSTNLTNSQTIASGINNIIMGAKKNGGSYSSYFKGKIAEILIFNQSLSGEDRREVERYLGRKWGIKISAID